MAEEFEHLTEPKVKSALILVPHQDDEINIAGCLIPQMVKNDVVVTVCFVTNGDYEGKQEIRAKEAVKAAKVLGISRIIYLGYGDGGLQGGSLYHAKDFDEVIVSPSGHSETYGTKEFNDFHFEEYGSHASYTKNNLLQDIKSVLLKNHADLLFCIDEDFHPDHKLVSELFDKALSELIQETDYRPLVLKKFAYLGIWHGKDDYFFRPMQPTECVSYGKYATKICCPHDWSKRLRFAVPSEIYSLCFWNSPVFRAIKNYSSQYDAFTAFLRIVNSDAVYWYFETKMQIKDCNDFPIERTPFLFFKEQKSLNKSNCNKHLLLKYLFFLYWICFCRIPRKIKKILGI